MQTQTNINDVIMLSLWLQLCYNKQPQVYENVNHAKLKYKILF